MHKYEYFKLSDTETISEMLTRFTAIVNSLKAPDRDMPNAELMTRSYPHFQKFVNRR